MNQFKFYFSIFFIFLLAISFSIVAQNESHVSAQLLFQVEQMAKQNSYEILIKIESSDEKADIDNLIKNVEEAASLITLCKTVSLSALIINMFLYLTICVIIMYI